METGLDAGGIEVAPPGAGAPTPPGAMFPTGEIAGGLAPKAGGIAFPPGGANAAGPPGRGGVPGGVLMRAPAEGGRAGVVPDGEVKPGRPPGCCWGIPPAGGKPADAGAAAPPPEAM